MLIRCIVIELMHYLILLNLLFSADTWTVSLVFYNNYMKSYIYRMDLNFCGTKLSRFSRFDSHPRKFSPATI